MILHIVTEYICGDVVLAEQLGSEKFAETAVADARVKVTLVTKRCLVT